MKLDELFRQANEAYEDGNFDGAFRLFLKGAELGDVSAMSNLATMYGAGEGIGCDLEKSVFWDLKAAESGNISSLLNLGITYRTIGDLKQARYWFEKSVEAGEGEGALQLAKLFVVNDFEQALAKKYLKFALKSSNLCELSREEASDLLRSIDNY